MHHRVDARVGGDCVTHRRGVGKRRQAMVHDNPLKGPLSRKGRYPPRSGRTLRSAHSDDVRGTTTGRTADDRHRIPGADAAMSPIGTRTSLSEISIQGCSDSGRSRSEWTGFRMARSRIASRSQLVAACVAVGGGNQPVRPTAMSTSNSIRPWSFSDEMWVGDPLRADDEIQVRRTRGARRRPFAGRGGNCCPISENLVPTLTSA